MGEKRIRIGGASAFYGDSQLAARQLVDRGSVGLSDIRLPSRGDDGYSSPR